jgi:exonuclease SbcD
MVFSPSQTSSLAGPKPPGGYRVIHTSDWHLGKPLGDLDRTEEARRFLDFLLETVISTQADALVVVGDIFDCATPPQSAVRLYFDFLAALYSRTGCVAIVTAGNHDSPSHLESPRDLLCVLRTHVVAEWAGEHSEMLIPLPSADAPQLLIAAVPFLRERDLRTGRMGQGIAEIEADLREGLQRRYAEIAEAARPWTERGVPVLAMGHLTALGAFTTADERLIHVGGLGKIGADAFPEAFAYVALGHLHRPQAVGGREQIRYSGSPLALSFGEAEDVKEVRLLDFVGGQLQANAPIPVPPFRRLIQLRLSQAGLETGLREFQPPASELPSWVEVIVEGATGTVDLFKIVQQAVEGRSFQVVKVTAVRAGENAALELDDAAAEADAENLLADPKAVFLRRLDREPDLEPTLRTDLETAFARLYDRYLEAEE